MSTADFSRPSPLAPVIPDVSSARKIFWVTWLGWMLDSFDIGIYIFILVPALTELLALEGMQPTRANVALYGGYLFSVFMLGWACSMFWGWLADRVGRVRVLCLTILVYAAFTGLCGLAWGRARVSVSVRGRGAVPERRHQGQWTVAMRRPAARSRTHRPSCQGVR